MAVFLISDLHFEDEDVISEFDRPFDSLEGMHETLVERWNRVVSSADTVIVVGDFARVETEIQMWVWLSKLQGEKILVYGNHCPVPRSSFDSSSLPLKPYYQFEKEGFEFYCAHKLSWIDYGWDGWKIYGHVHNRYPDDDPLIDPENKKINVSAELIRYQPIPIEKLIELINKGDTVVSLSSED